MRTGDEVFATPPAFAVRHLAARSEAPSFAPPVFRSKGAQNPQTGRKGANAKDG